MDAREYFPLGKANGPAFCNRKNETDLLSTFSVANTPS